MSCGAELEPDSSLIFATFVLSFLSFLFKQITGSTCPVRDVHPSGFLNACFVFSCLGFYVILLPAARKGN